MSQSKESGKICREPFENCRSRFAVLPLASIIIYAVFLVVLFIYLWKMDASQFSWGEDIPQDQQPYLLWIFCFIAWLFLLHLGRVYLSLVILDESVAAFHGYFHNLKPAQRLVEFTLRLSVFISTILFIEHFFITSESFALEKFAYNGMAIYVLLLAWDLLMWRFLREGASRPPSHPAGAGRLWILSSSSLWRWFFRFVGSVLDFLWDIVRIRFRRDLDSKRLFFLGNDLCGLIGFGILLGAVNIGAGPVILLAFVAGIVFIIGVGLLALEIHGNFTSVYKPHFRSYVNYFCLRCVYHDDISQDVEKHMHYREQDLDRMLFSMHDLRDSGISCIQCMDTETASRSR